MYASGGSVGPYNKDSTSDIHPFVNWTKRHKRTYFLYYQNNYNIVSGAPYGLVLFLFHIILAYALNRCPTTPPNQLPPTRAPPCRFCLPPPFLCLYFLFIILSLYKNNIIHIYIFLKITVSHTFKLNSLSFIKKKKKLNSLSSAVIEIIFKCRYDQQVVLW